MKGFDPVNGGPGTDFRGKMPKKSKNDLDRPVLIQAAADDPVRAVVFDIDNIAW